MLTSEVGMHCAEAKGLPSRRSTAPKFSDFSLAGAPSAEAGSWMLCLAYTYSIIDRDWLDTAAQAMLVELSDCDVGTDKTSFYNLTACL